MKLRREPPFLLLALISGLGLIPAGRARASSGSFQISGYVTDTLGNPIASLDVVGDDYVGDQFLTQTLDDGSYIVTVDADGNYRIRLDCGELTNRGFACVTPRSVTINDNSPTLNFVVERANNPLQITNTFLPVGNVGVGYSAQLGAANGAPPYTWQLALDSTNLPTGISLSSSGLIFGTPATNNVSSIKVQVTDANSAVTNKILSITINPKPVLSALDRVANRFSMWLMGASNQNYTIQAVTNLSSTNWISLFVTNSPAASSFMLTDPSATNQERFYRVLIGP